MHSHLQVGEALSVFTSDKLCLSECYFCSQSCYWPVAKKPNELRLFLFSITCFSSFLLPPSQLFLDVLLPLFIQSLHSWLRHQHRPSIKNVSFFNLTCCYLFINLLGWTLFIAYKWNCDCWPVYFCSSCLWRLCYFPFHADCFSVSLWPHFNDSVNNHM